MCSSSPCSTRHVPHARTLLKQRDGTQPLHLERIESPRLQPPPRQKRREPLPLAQSQPGELPWQVLELVLPEVGLDLHVTDEGVRAADRLGEGLEGATSHGPFVPHGESLGELGPPVFVREVGGGGERGVVLGCHGRSGFAVAVIGGRVEVGSGISHQLLHEYFGNGGGFSFESHGVSSTRHATVETAVIAMIVIFGSRTHYRAQYFFLGVNLGITNELVTFLRQFASLFQFIIAIVVVDGQ
mmetsp:Transcript_5500/g.11973  ORF Transcript_5500/g.11973 Transcript_5500/m.11973 type:complete len:242 (-) Transcript_5500:172-897(-)